MRASIKAFVSVRTLNMDYNLWGMMRHGARFALSGGGPASYIFPAVAFTKLSPGAEYPDLEFHFGAFASDVTPAGPRMLDRPAIMIQPNVNRSRSRGQVRLASSDPHAPPRIQPNLLSDPYDLETLVAGARFTRALLRTEAFAPYFQGEFKPGEGVGEGGALVDFVRANAGPCFHASGSVKMGVDAAAVVDQRLRVIGTRGLRVVDSSVIPQVPSGNINAITMVIAEKGADMILADATA
jgi:choline dehydrogenase